MLSDWQGRRLLWKCECYHWRGLFIALLGVLLLDAALHLWASTKREEAVPCKNQTEWRAAGQK